MVCTIFIEKWRPFWFLETGRGGFHVGLWCVFHDGAGGRRWLVTYDLSCVWSRFFFRVCVYIRYLKFWLLLLNSGWNPRKTDNEESDFLLKYWVYIYIFDLDLYGHSQMIKIARRQSTICYLRKQRLVVVIKVPPTWLSTQILFPISQPPLGINSRLM